MKNLARDIAEMFGELDGSSEYEDRLYVAYKYQLASAAARIKRFKQRAKKDPVKLAKLRAQGRAQKRRYYQKLKTDPRRYAAHLRYQRDHKRSRYVPRTLPLSCKLTHDIVREIRESPLTQVRLAVKYGVSQATISRVRTGKFLAHVAREGGAL